MDLPLTVGLGIIPLGHIAQLLAVSLELLFLSMELPVFLLLSCHSFININGSLSGPSCIDRLTNLQIPQILERVFHSVINIVFHVIVDGSLRILDLLGLTEFSV